jgi:hypothetical protein
MPILRWYFLLLLLLLWPGAGAAAAAFSLTERDQQEAIAVGRQSVYGAGFGAEWQVSNAAGDALAVMTPFHRLALAARNAGFRSDTLRPRDVETILRSATGKLEFWATLHGTAPDFARFYAPTVVPAGQPPIRPTFVQNERTALPEGGGRYTARCLYVFSTEGLSPTGRLTLVVRNQSEVEVATFTVDLATMR